MPRYLYSALWPVFVIALVITVCSCDNNPPSKPGNTDDGQVVPTKDLRDDPTVLSPPILSEPIYECTDTVFVQGYVPNAEIQIFVAGNSTPIAKGTVCFRRCRLRRQSPLPRAKSSRRHRP